MSIYKNTTDPDDIGEWDSSKTWLTREEWDSLRERLPAIKEQWRAEAEANNYADEDSDDEGDDE